MTLHFVEICIFVGTESRTTPYLASFRLRFTESLQGQLIYQFVQIIQITDYRLTARHTTSTDCKAHVINENTKNWFIKVSIIQLSARYLFIGTCSC